MDHKNNANQRLKFKIYYNFLLPKFLLKAMGITEKCTNYDRKSRVKY